MKEKVRINSQIQAPELRIVDEVGGSLGVMTLSQALEIATGKGLDLIEISPKAVPPVGKIMDYGKYQYQHSKKVKQSRARSHTTETKSLQVTIGTGDHDLEIKAIKASEFLHAGHRVKIDLFLRGRVKYFDHKFLSQRLERLLKFIALDYRIAVPATRSPKGLTLVIERGK